MSTVWRTVDVGSIPKNTVPGTGIVYSKFNEDVEECGSEMWAILNCILSNVH
mgnify:FL=1